MDTAQKKHTDKYVSQYSVRGSESKTTALTHICTVHTSWVELNWKVSEELNSKHSKSERAKTQTTIHSSVHTDFCKKSSLKYEDNEDLNNHSSCWEQPYLTLEKGAWRQRVLLGLGYKGPWRELWAGQPGGTFVTSTDGDRNRTRSGKQSQNCWSGNYGN